MAQTLTSRTSNNAPPAQLASRTFSSTGVPQTDAATFIPVEGSEADGWINIANYRRVHASVSAAGAAIVVTCQVRTCDGAPAIALTLADGSVASGASELLLDADVGAGAIRFLADGTAGVSNTLDLFVNCKA
jgi:hypothetical protein